MIDVKAIFVSLFFAFFIALYHLLYCIYVSKDPYYQGKLSIGWPWLHYHRIYLNKPIQWYKNYIFQSTITLFVCSLIITFVTVNLLLNLNGITFAELIIVILPLFAICAFSQLIGVTAYKGWLSLLLTILIFILLLRWSDYYQQELINYTVIVLILITIIAAFYWKKIIYKNKPKECVYIMPLYSAIAPILTWIVWVALFFYL